MQFLDGDFVVVIDVGPTTTTRHAAPPANGNVYQYRIEKPAAMRAVPV